MQQTAYIFVWVGEWLVTKDVDCNICYLLLKIIVKVQHICIAAVM